MKRKICLLLAAVLLLLSLGACAEEETDIHTLYTKAKELYLGGYSATVDFKMTVGEKSAEGEFQVKTAGNDASVTRTDSVDSRYYVGGVAYRCGYILNDVYYGHSDESPAKIQMACTKEEFQKECTSFFCVNPFASAFPTITEDAIKNAEVTTSNGRTGFVADITADAVKAYLCDDLITDAEGAIAVAFDEIGDMTSMTLQLVVSYAEGEQKTFEITYQFSNIGFVPAIMKPTDASEYIEL